MKKINIAIDGPSGAGKSTVAKLLANKLSYIHIDTGAMYRAVALKCISNNISLDDEIKIKEILKDTKISFDDNGDTYLDFINVSNEIRTNEMSLLASNVSKLLCVREYLVLQQQIMSKDKGFILDGRDIGTVVLKDAEVKVFLTATTTSRANRRHKQNIEKNIESNLEKIEVEIKQRDYQDINRENSPLKQADDAILIDSSNLTIDEVVNKIIEMIKGN